MAAEVSIAYGLTGKTLYFDIRTKVGTIWNGSAFEAYNASNIADYDIAMTEQGACGVYVGTFDSSVSAGMYDVVVRDRAGGSPAETDPVIGSGMVNWTGSAVGVPSSFDASSDTVDVGKISGDSTAANNAVLFFDGTGYGIQAASNATTVDVGKISGDSGAADALERMLEGVQTGSADTTTASGTTTVFETSLTEASDDHYNNQALIWGASAANAGLTFYITDSQGTTANSNNKVKLTVQTMPNAPGNGDVFEIVGTKGS